MTVWAVSPFYNELDVLEIKLATLDHLVDRWVLAEATADQRGRSKPRYLDAFDSSVLDRFARWGDKITVVTVDDMPTEQPDDPEGTLEHWKRENFQRDALIRGMDGLADDDRVLISDLDEIPYPHALEEALNAEPGLRFPMDMHVYRLNWRWAERPVLDGSTAIIRTGRDVLEYGVHGALLSPDLPSRWRGDPAWRLSSGWHLAYQYDADGIRRKTEAIADNAWTQLIPDDKKNDPSFWLTDPRQPSQALLERCIATGCDIYGRDHRQAEWVDLDQLPPYVTENTDQFAHMLVGPPR